MILEVDWMFNYSPITFDFKQLQVKLLNQGEKMVLERKGNPNFGLRKITQLRKRTCATINNCS